MLWKNQVQGGGVAGVLVEGQATLIDNQFESKQPKQGTAVWVWAKSSTEVHRNSFSGYRHAVNANGAQVSVSNNQIREFENAAIIVKQSTHPAHVFGNQAHSKNRAVKAVVIEGEQGIVAGNHLIAEEN